MIVPEGRDAAACGWRSYAADGLLPEDLIDIVTFNRLHYDHGSETGVLFHLMGALSEFGKVGLTAIGNSPEQADEIYARTVAVLDKETVYGRSAARGGSR